MSLRIAINGFGRIGRSAFKIALTKPGIEVVAINDLTDPKTLAHLLQYDSVYGRYDKTVEHDEGHLVIEEKKILVLSKKEPGELPWKEMAVDVVLECTGRFTDGAAAEGHIQAGAKRVVISAPSSGDKPAPTYLLGVNNDKQKGEVVINNASCTTNCIAPTLAVLHANFKVLKAMMTTAHAYTAEQNLVDGPPPPLHHDLRRARSAATNIVPTTTGAAIATTEAIPELKGRFAGTAIRVPVAVGSISDITALVEKKTTVEEVNAAFKKATVNPLWKGIIATTDLPLVSSDIIGDPHSAIIDLSMTQVLEGDFVKVFAWYDNEWGYSNRLVEQAMYVGQ